MIHFVQNIKNPFVSNVLKIMSASTLGYLSMLVALPFLSRVYTPEDFGVFGLFWAVSVTISVVSAAGFEYTIVLPDETEDAVVLLIISSTFVLCTALFTAAIDGFVGTELLAFLEQDKLETLGLYVALMVLQRGLFNVFNFWLTRRRQFNLISVGRFLQTFSIALFQLLIAYGFALDYQGLIIGTVLGQTVASAFLGWHTARQVLRDHNGAVPFSRIVRNIKRYRAFLKFHTLSNLLNNGGHNLPFVLLGYFFTPTIVGYYNISIQILSAPVDFISRAIGPVYMLELQAEGQKTGTTSHLIRRLYFQLAILFSPVLLALLLFGEDIFALVLGEEWRPAGMFALILAPVHLFFFVYQPTSMALEIYEKLKVRLAEQFSFFLISLFSFTIGGWIGNIFFSLALFSGLSSIRCLIVMVYVLRLGGSPADESGIAEDPSRIERG